MTKFKIGQKVLVKPDLIINSTYNGCVFVPEMTPFLGKVVTINWVSNYSDNSYKNQRYHVLEDRIGWFFSNDMLCSVKQSDCFIDVSIYL